MQTPPTTFKTIHTTLTLRSPSPDFLTLHPPSRSRLPSPQYTTYSIPTSLGEKFYPGAQPLVVGTVLEAVIVGGNEGVLSTATVTFGEDGKELVGASTRTGAASIGAVTSAATSDTTTAVVVGAMENGWAGWSDAERGGVVAAAILAGIGLLATMTVVGWANWRRGVKRRTLARGVVFGEPGRKKRGRKGRVRGIEGMEKVEMGPAAMKVVYGDLIARGETGGREKVETSKVLPTLQSAPES